MESNSESKLCETFSSNNLPLAEELLEKQLNDESNSEIGDLKKILQSLDTRRFYEITGECVLDNHFNLLSFMLTSLEPLATPFELWTENEVLPRASEKHQIDSIEKLWKLAESMLSSEEIVNLLKFEYYDVNVLHRAIRNEDAKVFKFFLDKSRKLLNHEDQQHLMFPARPLWLYFDEGEQNGLNRCQENFTKEEFKRFLTSTDNAGRTMLLNPQRPEAETITKILDFIEVSLGKNEIRELLMNETCRGDNFLMATASTKDEAAFNQSYELVQKYFNEAEIREMFLKENKENQTCLHKSALNSRSKVFDFVRAIYEVNFEQAQVDQILMREFENYSNIFLVNSWWDKSRLEFLFDFGEKRFGGEKLKEILVKNCKNTDTGLIYDFHHYANELPMIIEDFIFRTCSGDKSSESFHFWLFAARYSSLEFIEKLTKIERDREFAKVLLQFKKEKGKNILDYAAEDNFGDESNTKVLECLKQYLDK
jgi:hypothetical protein